MLLTNFYNTKQSLNESKKNSLDLEVVIALQVLWVVVLKMLLKTTNSLLVVNIFLWRQNNGKKNLKS
jgi:hypothetical protein